MPTPGMSQGQWKRVVSDQLLFTGDGLILALIAHHTSTTTFEINDSTDNSGADVLSVQVPANDTLYLDLSRTPIPFVTGAYADFAAGVIYVLLDA